MLLYALERPPLERLRAASTSRDPELRYRAAMVIDHYVRRELERMQPVPMIDALWYDVRRGEYSLTERSLTARLWKALASPYLDRAQRRCERRIDRRFGAYYEATEDWAMDLLKSGTPPQTIRKLFTLMRRRDAVYYARTEIKPYYAGKDFEP
jgi:hypothetical protein